jgi:hypothetical protein
LGTSRHPGIHVTRATVSHSRVGDLRLEHHRLAPSDHPELHLVIYTPVDDGATPGRLRELIDSVGPSGVS